MIVSTTRHTFQATDGTGLIWYEAGQGRPVILLHGLFSNGFTNWVRYGQAALLVDAGFRVILPDLRGHGESGAPHEAAAYPPDILADDGFALIAHLGLEEGDYDLGGYSLGARTTLRMLVKGARPRRAIIAGMGISGMRDTQRRAEFFRKMLAGWGTHARGSGAWMAEAFLKTTGGDRAAMVPLLDSFVDTADEALGSVATETLVIAGVDDDDNGSAEALAGLLPHARYASVPGNHMSAVLAVELGQEMVAFLQS